MIPECRARRIPGCGPNIQRGGDSVRRERDSLGGSKASLWRGRAGCWLAVQVEREGEDSESPMCLQGPLSILESGSGQAPFGGLGARPLPAPGDGQHRGQGLLGMGTRGHSAHPTACGRSASLPHQGEVSRRDSRKGGGLRGDCWGRGGAVSLACAQFYPMDPQLHVLYNWPLWRPQKRSRRLQGLRHDQSPRFLLI